MLGECSKNKIIEDFAELKFLNKYAVRHFNRAIYFEGFEKEMKLRYPEKPPTLVIFQHFLIENLRVDVMRCMVRYGNEDMDWFWLDIKLGHWDRLTEFCVTHMTVEEDHATEKRRVRYAKK